jgi:anhydro-N-acetylmuramic acid kinase
MKNKAIIVAGVMSGTSADGINVAFVRIGNARSSASQRRFGAAARIRGPEGPRHIELLGHAEHAYPKRVREAVLSAMNASRARVADLARLNFLLGELYADAVRSTERRFRVKADLVGCHGQTLYHQGEGKRFLGRSVAATWQTGEAAVVAARVGVPVVSDFRPADMVAGGQGAPLVPFLDYSLFRDEHVGRIVQNIGGIANLTFIPAGATAEDVVAFDTGPGNMVIDAVTEQLFGQAFDRNGRIAHSGSVLEPVIRAVLSRAFFLKRPPKTAGREEFGRKFVRRFLRMCQGAKNNDIVATATAITARSIADAIRRFIIRGPRYGATHAVQEMILSGGGTRNATLVEMLRKQLKPLGTQLRLSDEYGVPSEAKEAAAFAVLAYETWHRRPSNVPSATGAKRAAILGKISYP